MALKPRIMLLLAATALWPASQAMAVDYEPPIFVEEAEEYVPVEVGSGWYLRGDVAYNFQRKYRDTGISVDDSLFDNDLVGLTTIGAIDLFSYKESDHPISGSIGFGYHFNDYLRADLNLGMYTDQKSSISAHLFAGDFSPFTLIDSLDPNETNMPDFGCLGSRTVTTTTTVTTNLDTTPVTGTPAVNSNVDADWRRDCMVRGSVNNRAWTGMANGYIDLGTYVGFTPYVGAGVGLLYSRTKIAAGATCEGSRVIENASTTSGTVRTDTETETTFQCRGQAVGGEPVEYETASYNHSEYNFMYGLSAGVSYQLSQNTSLDVGYQFTSAPGLTYFSANSDGIGVNKGMDFHQFKVGLRYDLW